MAKPSNDFLENAAVLGLAIPAGAMVGSKAAESIPKPSSYEDEKDYREKMRGKNYGKPDTKEEKLEQLKRSIEPSGGDNKSTGSAKVMKKGGKVSSASKRGDGIAQRGKTKGRFV